MIGYSREYRTSRFIEDFKNSHIPKSVELWKKNGSRKKYTEGVFMER